MSEGSGMMIDLIKLDTEKNNHRTIDIDAVSTEEILRKINNEVRRLLQSLKRV